MFTLEDWIVDIALLLIIVGGITAIVATIPAQITAWAGLILLAIGTIMIIAVLLFHFWKKLFK